VGTFNGKVMKIVFTRKVGLPQHFSIILVINLPRGQSYKQFTAVTKTVTKLYSMPQYDAHMLNAGYHAYVIGWVVSYNCIIFISLGPEGRDIYSGVYHKTHYDRNLRISVIS
jgi:hypothetical protein